MVLVALGNRRVNQICLGFKDGRVRFLVLGCKQRATSVFHELMYN